MNPTLEELLRRPDPAVGAQVELVAVTASHKRNKLADWNEADGGSGLPAGMELTDNGSLRLVASVTTKLELLTSNSVFVDLNRNSPFSVAECQWGGGEPQDWELRQITAHLNPAFGGSKNVTFWVGQLFALARLEGDGLFTKFLLVPLHGPIIVVAGASAGDVTFAPPIGSEFQPKIVGPPENGGTAFRVPTTYFFIFALKNDGSSATNVAWSVDSTVAEVLTAGNRLNGVQLLQNADGSYKEPTPLSTPRCSFRAGNFTAATATWTTNLFDLGAAPAAGERVQLIGLAQIPAGTSVTFEVRNDADTAWLTYTDGLFADTLTGVTNKQTYKLRVTLTPDSSTNITPVLVEIGIASVTIEDVSEIVEVANVSWGFDPPTLKGQVSELALRAITDGPRDFDDLLTELLTTFDLADILLRLYVGAPGLDRQFWLHIDDFFIDDVAWVSGEYRIIGLSMTHLLRSTLPKFNDVTNERTRLEFVNTGLKTFWDSLLNNEIAVPARFIGPGVEDDATQITDKITDSDGKVEVDSVAYLDGRTVLTSQGRIKAVRVLDGFGIAGFFPLEEIDLVQVTPGLRQRSPEFVVQWDFDFISKEFGQEVRRVHLASLNKLGSAKLDTVKFLTDRVARKITTQALASKVAQAYADAFGPGLIQVDFRPIYSFPELEPGDMVAVQFEGLAIKDPNTGRAIKGALWGYGPIRNASGWKNDTLSVWIRSYSDIFSSFEDVVRRAFVEPEIVSITATVVGGDVSVTIQTRNALSVRVKATNVSFPTKTQVQAEAFIATDADGLATSATLVVLAEGETAFISALAYERADGTGRETVELTKITAVEDAGLGLPVIVRFAIQIDADTGTTRPIIQVTDALSVRVASSLTAFPSRATTQAAALQTLDSDGNLVGANLVSLASPGTLFATALAFQNVDGTGVESTVLYKAQKRRLRAERIFPFDDDEFAIRGVDSDGRRISLLVDESGGKRVNLLYAKLLAGNPDTLDSINEGVTFKRTTANEKTGGGRGFTGFTSGVDLEPAVKIADPGAIRSIFRHLEEAVILDIDGDAAVTFPTAFQSAPSIIMLFEQIVTFNTSLGTGVDQATRLKAQNISTTGFDAIARNLNPGATTARSDSFATGNMVTVGNTKEANMNPAVANDNNYTWHYKIDLTALGAVGSCGSITVTLALDTNDGSGWVERSTHVYSADSAPGCTSNDTPSFPHEQKTNTVSGLGLNDDVRIRVKTVVTTGLGGFFIAHGFGTTDPNHADGDPADGLTYTTASDTVESAMPATGYGIRYQAREVT